MIYRLYITLILTSTLKPRHPSQDLTHRCSASPSWASLSSCHGYQLDHHHSAHLQVTPMPPVSSPSARAVTGQCVQGSTPSVASGIHCSLGTFVPLIRGNYTSQKQVRFSFPQNCAPQKENFLSFESLQCYLSSYILNNRLWGMHNGAEKAMAPHSRTLAWKTSWTEEPGGQQSTGSWRVGHDWATSLSFLTFMHWRRKWQPTPVFLPGESQGRWSPVGCRLWGHTESDTTEATQQRQQHCCCLVSKSSLTLCDLMHCSRPDFRVLHYLQEFAQTHVHWVSETI